MTLVNCKECGNQVSTKAEACPSCGAKVPKSVRGGCLPSLGIVFLVLVIIGMIGQCSNNSGPSSRATSESHRESTKAPTPEDLAHEKEQAEAKRKAEEAKEAEDKILVLASAGARTLKTSMRNPDSFKLASALVTEPGAVCYEYRGQNGFGGMNVGHAVLAPEGNDFKTDEEDGFRTLWNRYCASKPGVDYSRKIQIFL